MINFREGAMYITKKYKVSIADANAQLKSINEDINDYGEPPLNSIADLENYLTKLENYER